jgi:hypothetical protein
MQMRESEHFIDGGSERPRLGHPLQCRIRENGDVVKVGEYAKYAGNAFEFNILDPHAVGLARV